MTFASWHDGELSMQRSVGVSDHARLRRGVRHELPPHFIEFLSAQRLLVVATHDQSGWLWCSLVPGWPGFATSPAPDIVRIDRRAFVQGDVLMHLQSNPSIGMLAFDPSTRRRIRINGTAIVEENDVVVHVLETFGNCQQYVQKRSAEGPVPSPVTLAHDGPDLMPAHLQWIAGCDTCFIGSSHPRSGPDASHRGGRPGFITNDGPRMLRFPDYSGNDMFQTLGNFVVNSAAALLFVNFDTGAVLQLLGAATVHVNEAPPPYTGRSVVFEVRRVVERRPAQEWRWPVLEYSPVNP